MFNKYISAIFLAGAAVTLASCDDYLDREPESSLIPDTFFTSEDNLRSFTQRFYTWLDSHSNYDYGFGTFGIDNGTDNQISGAAPDRYAPGYWLVGSGSDNWDFSRIRAVNYFFKMTLPNYEAGTINGGSAAIDQAIGEAYFARAYIYWTYYKKVGDYPIITDYLGEERDELLASSRRQPRHKVAHFILDDLEKAIELLPETSDKGKNGLNKDCARLLRSRVALFEGSWLKYHKGSALVPGGKGWPGNPDDVKDFDIDADIKYFFTEATKDSKVVADKYVDRLAKNTDAENGVDPGMIERNPYFNMFGSENLDGYDEVLLYRAYSSELGVTLGTHEAGLQMTHGMMQSYVMRNGLPIYAPGSGYDPDWEDEGLTPTIQGRDSRLHIFVAGDSCYINYGESGHEIQVNNMGSFMENSAQGATGIGIKKVFTYTYPKGGNSHGRTRASIIFRGVEALLNYMEASYELNGKIDDSADKYWRAIRTRAYVDPDYNVTIKATDLEEEAKYDWGVYSRNAKVSPELYNIRRERRLELLAEGFRLDDLRRWSAMDQLIDNPYQIEGVKYWGTCYANRRHPQCFKDTNGKIIRANVSPDNGMGNMSDKSLSPYLRSYQVSRVQNKVWDGLSWTRAHYLYPIGFNAFMRTSDNGSPEGSVIYQNPGWQRNANTGASVIE